MKTCCYKISALFFLNLSAFLIFILSGCNDKPTDIGVPLLKDTVALNKLSSADTTIILGVQSYMFRIPLFNTGMIYIGRYFNNTTQVETRAFSMIRFGWMPDSLAFLNDASKIDSVVLTFYPLRYVLGTDTLSYPKLSFGIYGVQQLWTFNSTWDSIYDAAGHTNFFGNEQLGSFNSSIPLKDTMPPFTVQISKNYISQWFTTDTSIKGKIYGLAFLPDTINNRIVQKFSAQKIGVAGRDQPKMTVYYRDSTTHLQDTVTFYSANDAAFSNTSIPDKNAFLIQGGLSIRSKLSFDLSMLPRNCGIHKAELQLTFDRNKTVYANFGQDTVIKAGIYENDNDLSPSIYYYGNLISDSDNYIFSSVASAIDRWVRSSGGKGNLIFTVNDDNSEILDLDRYAFYGPGADSTKRPRLRIIYSYIQQK